MLRKLAVLTGLLAVVVLLVPQARAEETYRLSYSNFFPPTHVQSKLGEEWAREVEKRTDGKVKIDYYPGGTLTKAKNVYDGVIQGLSDMGMSVLAYSRGRFPVMAAVDLPMGYPDGVTATRVANGVYEEFQPAEMDDTEVMYFHAHGPGVLCTRETAVTNMDQMKGLKLRATGNSAKIVDALGGTPVAMSMPDSYQSIQKGVVDGGVYPMETNKGWKMGEVVDYCTVASPTAYTTAFFVVMNKDKWNALPEDAKATIREINAEWAAKHGQAWDQADAEGKEFFLGLGHEIVSLSPEETERWNKAVAPVVKAYVTDSKEKDIDGQAVVDFIKAEVAESQ